jgi:PPOX class probable F420-dependent enzyme
MSVRLSAGQIALLHRMRNVTLATIGAAGAPHVAPVWYLWDGEQVRVSTPGWTTKVADVRANPQVALCFDDQVSGEYLTIYGSAEVVADERVTELSRPLLLAYLPPDEADARWARINADGSRVVILITPRRVAGRENVR